MKSLLERELMAAKVQMVYVDPPYGVKFPSNFAPRIDRCDGPVLDAARALARTLAGGQLSTSWREGGFCRSNARVLALVSYGTRR
jgi:hypothetical protein